ADREILTAVVEGMAEALSWSPSRGWLGILTSNNAERRLLALKTDGTQLVLLDRTVAPDGNIVMAEWISERVLLATRGTHTSQLMAAYDLNSMTGRMISPDFPVRSDFLSHPSASPDGAHIAAVKVEPAAGCDSQEILGSLWIVEAATGSLEQLVPPVCELARLAWSPDGSRLAYTNASADPDIAGVYVVGLGEQIPRRVSPGQNMVELRWTADGQSLISIRHTCLRCGAPGHWPVLIDAGGRGERVVAESYPNAVANSGRMAAYVNLDGSLLINDLDTGATHTAMEADADRRVEALAWAPDSSLLALTRTTSFGVRYFEVDTHDMILERFFPPGGVDPVYYDPSPAGDRVAYGVREQDGTVPLRLSNPDGTSEVRVELAVPGTPKWSPTGAMLAVSAQSSLGYGMALYIVSPDGAVLRSIGPPTAGADQAAWSPDGRYLAVPGWTLDIYDLLGGTGVSIPVEFAMYVQWSPDGAGLAFADEGTNGQFDVFLVNPDGSQLRAVTSDPASDYSPAFSPDGSQLAFRRSYLGGEQYHILDLETGAERALIAEAPNGGPVIWFADGSRFLTAATLPAGRGLWSVDPVSGTAELLVVSAHEITGVRWLSRTCLYFSLTHSGM
ncbi:MAG TPA: hypothetical protein VFO59_05850, partial [Dehalococcoidia bacterium]|nr:hypothetical protein [Dehalococcoidia bacterium]